MKYRFLILKGLVLTLALFAPGLWANRALSSSPSTRVAICDFPSVQGWPAQIDADAGTGWAHHLSQLRNNHRPAQQAHQKHGKKLSNERSHVPATQEVSPERTTRLYSLLAQVELGGPNLSRAPPSPINI